MTISIMLVTAFLVSLAFGLLGIRIAPILGLLDIPGGRRQHDAPIPRVGGLALVASLSLVSALLHYRVPLTRLEIGAFGTMAILGFLDDRIDLRARWKACLGLLVAVVLATGATSHLTKILEPYDLLWFSVPAIPWIAFTLLMLLFWCIPHAFNLIDGANGLATGFALVVVGSLWGTGTPHPILAGALLGCLVLNWPKAKLFLGDCGSLSIGLLLVLYAQKALAMPRPNHLLWLFAYPIIDVLTVVIIRGFTRQPFGVGDRNHLHYQIIDRWPALAPFAVPILLGIAAMCASEIYLTGIYRIVPCVGLIILIALSTLLAVTRVTEFRNERSLKSDGLLNGSNPTHQNDLRDRVQTSEHEWPKKLTLLTLIGFLIDASRR